MIIGVPKEIKNHEYRVGLTPRSVKELVRNGHKVMVQTSAGKGIGASDNEYIDNGAEIIATSEEIMVSTITYPHEFKILSHGCETSKHWKTT